MLQAAEGAEETGEALKAEVAALTAQLRQSEEASKAAQERYLRLTADFENFRKRSVSAPPPHEMCPARQQCSSHDRQSAPVMLTLGLVQSLCAAPEPCRLVYCHVMLYLSWSRELFSNLVW